MAAEDESSVLQISFPTPQAPAFDAVAFDDAIRAHGTELVHYRAMRNPVGLVDKYDSRRPDEDHTPSSNGMLYTKAGCFSALFLSNSKAKRDSDWGFINDSEASITPTRHYTGGEEEVYLYPMDRLFLDNSAILVVRQETVEAHETGIDDLSFPVVKVQDLVDASGIRYKPGSEFKVKGGKIVWCSNKRPGINPELDIGRIYTVRYLYRPFWYVHQLNHEIRVAQFLDPIKGKVTIKMNQQAIVMREHIYEKEQNDEAAPQSGRQAKGPRNGGFGPR